MSSMVQKPVLTGHTRDGRLVEVFDLVPAYTYPASREWNRLFDESQTIYDKSFKEHERESRRTVRYEYVHHAAKDRNSGTHDEYGPSTFFYQVPVIDGHAVGMYSVDLQQAETFLQAYGNYLCIDEKHRQQGIAHILVEAMMASCNERSVREGKPFRYSFGEVEKPELDGSDDVKDRIRPDFHHNVMGRGAAAIVKSDGKVSLLPHAWPGIYDGNRFPDPEPSLLAIAPVEGGRIRKITAQPGMVSPDGYLSGDREMLTALSPEDVLEMMDALYDDYRTSDSYDPGQVDMLKEGSRGVLDRVPEVHLVPMADTKYLPYSSF